MSENEHISNNRGADENLPAEIGQALARYVEIQKESTALNEERYRLRDQIAAYMEGSGLKVLLKSGRLGRFLFRASAVRT